MIKSILAASVVSVGVVSAAFALPAHVAAPSPANQPDILHVKKDWKHDDWKHDDWKHNSWKHSNNWHKYNKNRYSGWQSYSYRPYGWANRGCVVVGPIWYCP